MDRTATPAAWSTWFEDVRNGLAELMAAVSDGDASWVLPLPSPDCPQYPGFLPDIVSVPHDASGETRPASSLAGRGTTQTLVATRPSVRPSLRFGLQARAPSARVHGRREANARAVGKAFEHLWRLLGSVADDFERAATVHDLAARDVLAAFEEEPNLLVTFLWCTARDLDVPAWFPALALTALEAYGEAWPYFPTLLPRLGFQPEALLGVPAHMAWPHFIERHAVPPDPMDEWPPRWAVELPLTHWIFEQSLADWYEMNGHHEQATAIYEHLLHVHGFLGEEHDGDEDDIAAWAAGHRRNCRLVAKQMADERFSTALERDLRVEQVELLVLEKRAAADRVADWANRAHVRLSQEAQRILVHAEARWARTEDSIFADTEDLMMEVGDYFTEIYRALEVAWRGCVAGAIHLLPGVGFEDGFCHTVKAVLSDPTARQWVERRGGSSAALYDLFYKDSPLRSLADLANTYDHQAHAPADLGDARRAHRELWKTGRRSPGLLHRFLRALPRPEPA